MKEDEIQKNEIRLDVEDKKEIENDFLLTNAAIFPTKSGWQSMEVHKIIREPREIVKLVMPTKRQEKFDKIFKGLVGLGFPLLILAYILYLTGIFTKKVSENQTTTSYYYHKTQSDIHAVSISNVIMIGICALQIMMLLVKLFFNYHPNEREFLKYFDSSIRDKINAQSSYLVRFPELEHFNIWINNHQDLVHYLGVKGHWIAIASLIIATFDKLDFAIPICDGVQEGNGNNNKFEKAGVVNVPSAIYHYFRHSTSSQGIEALSKEEKDPAKYSQNLLYFILNAVTHELQFGGNDKKSCKRNLVILLKELLNSKIFMKNIVKDNLSIHELSARTKWSLLFSFLLTSENDEKGAYIVYHEKVFQPKLSEFAIEAFYNLKNSLRDLLIKSLRSTQYGSVIGIMLQSGANQIESSRLHHSVITFLTMKRRGAERESHRKKDKEKRPLIPSFNNSIN